ncbi:MAG: hypothetical protein M1839_000956 [Geoglossum umbratile]|nr:MAG: hypothetical protein M1839_000956 [Geoglossum umbratile]
MRIPQLLSFLIGCASLTNAVTIWWDSSCPQNVKDAFQEAKQYAKLGASSVPSGGALYSQIFKTGSKTTVGSILQGASQSSETQTRDNSHDQLAIYCDQDRRWTVASDDIIPGNSRRKGWPKAQHDTANDIIFDPKGVTIYKKVSDVPAESRQPGCQYPGTNAETYVRFDREAQGYTKFATMTICDIRYKNGVSTRLKEVIDGGKDLGAGTPSIDEYTLLAQTILHEMTHHPSLGDTDDFDYKWEGITSLSAGDALKNADSYAYFGLGAFLLQHIDIHDDGTCHKRDDPVTKRWTPAKCRDREVRARDEECAYARL